MIDDMSDVAPAAFVGRHVEQLALLDAWARASDGTASVVLVGGEAGIGKSRLLRELADEVDRTGGRWLLGGCTSQAGSVQPFGPLVAALRSLARSRRRRRAAPPGRPVGQRPRAPAPRARR